MGQTHSDHGRTLESSLSTSAAQGRSGLRKAGARPAPTTISPSRRKGGMVGEINKRKKYGMARQPMLSLARFHRCQQQKMAERILPTEKSNRRPLKTEPGTTAGRLQNWIRLSIQVLQDGTPKQGGEQPLSELVSHFPKQPQYPPHQ